MTQIWVDNGHDELMIFLVRDIPLYDLIVLTWFQIDGFQRKDCASCTIYHVSYIMYHVSCIMYHISYIMYHVLYHIQLNEVKGSVRTKGLVTVIGVFLAELISAMILITE